MDFWFALLCVASVTAQFNPDNYDGSQVLQANTYTLYWKILQSSSSIQLALQYQGLTDWVGFGLAEQTTGGMPGSDIVTVLFMAGSQPAIEDRWAAGYVVPAWDDCQNWNLVSATQENGLTTVEVSRLLDTGMGQDRPFVAGSMHVVWAYGSQYAGEISQHAFNGSDTAEVTFFGATPAPPPPSNPVTWNHLMPNIAISSVNETYTFCQSLNVTDFMNYHVIQINPMVDPNTAALETGLVTDIWVYTCDANSLLFTDPVDCYGYSQTDFGTMCTQTSLLYVWSMGGDPLVLPPLAGFPVGLDTNAPVHQLILQVFYNNDQEQDFVDNSGVQLLATNPKRQYDAAIMTLGDPLYTLPDIPEGQPNYMAEITCPSECSVNWTQPLNVFGLMNHMHRRGIMAWSTQSMDSGAPLGSRVRQEFFALQTQMVVPTNFTVFPTDRLNLHCVWNTLSDEFNIPFGDDPEWEQCMQYMFYYPAQYVASGAPFQWCSYFDANSSNANVAPQTLCGEAVFEKALFNVYNPTISDPPGGINRVFGQITGVCTTGTPPPTDAPGPSPSHGGAIAGGIIGGLIGLAILIFAVWYILRRKGPARKSTYESIGSINEKTPQ